MGTAVRMRHWLVLGMLALSAALALRWSLRGDARPRSSAAPVPSPAQDRPTAVHSLRSPSTPVAREVTDAPAQEPPLADEAWRPPPGSPVALLDAGEWWPLFEPSFENMLAHLRGVPRFAGCRQERLRALWDDPELRAAWERGRELLALRVFVGDHARRESERWAAGARSIALETELAPAAAFVDALPAAAAVWAAIGAYSSQVADALREHGEAAPARDDVPAKWPLYALFTAQGRDDIERIETFLGDCSEKR